MHVDKIMGEKYRSVSWVTIRASKYRFDICWEVSEGWLAFGIFQEQNYYSHELYNEFYDAYDQSKWAYSDFRILVTIPGDTPVDNPDHVGEEGECHEIPQSGFLPRFLVGPEEKGESKERKIIVRSLKVSEAGEDNEGKE